jgi:predicted metal-dependent phosphoesterase TrpH
VSVLDDFADVIALSKGANFVRGDLHIHSNAGSHDVSDSQATPGAIVDEAEREGLSIMAIADHTEIDGSIAAVYNLN